MDDDLLKPGKLTKIEMQKKHKHRVSLFIDGVYRFGIAEELLSRHQLQVGDQMTRDDLSFILEQEDFRKALSSAYALLARRARSTAEVNEKLQLYGHHQVVVEKVVTKLKAENYLDDYQFAHSFAKSRLASKPMGRLLLLQEIRRRLVGQTIAEEIVNAVFIDLPENELARQALAKKGKAYRGMDPEVAKQKKIRFLKNRGFSWETIRSTLEI